jgi:hypothetical protein
MTLTEIMAGWLLEHIEQLRTNSINANEVLRKINDALGVPWNPPDDEHSAAWTDSAATIAMAVRLQAQRQAALDLCDTADEAELKPCGTGFEPISVPWTLAVRKCLGAGDD